MLGSTSPARAPTCPLLRAPEGWADLPAVRAARVTPWTGPSTSRPGPRVVDELEITAEILHPELFVGRFLARDVVRVPAETASGGTRR